MKITITVGDISLPAELNENPTAQQIAAALPLEGKANIWGDEIYFETPIIAGQESNARAEVEVGELGYWPVGHAFCIFYGPTPVSADEKPRAYSPVNILGQVLDDATKFKGTPNGATVKIDKTG